MRILTFVAASLFLGCATDETPRNEEMTMRAAYGQAREWVVSDLEAAVAQAGGRVAIGFKNPGDERGVSDDGVVLASSASVAQAKADLRGMGISFTYEFVFMPAVLATITPSQVNAILNNSRIDYLEPPTSVGAAWDAK